MTWRMARRWRVRRMPLSRRVFWRWPVVSAVLMRSPEETRWDGDADMTFQILSRLEGRAAVLGERKRITTEGAEVPQSSRRKPKRVHHRGHGEHREEDTET